MLKKYIKSTFMSLTLLLSPKLYSQDPVHNEPDKNKMPEDKNLLSQEDLNLIEQNQDRFHAYLSADLVDCLSQMAESKDMPKAVLNLKNYAKDHRIADCDFMANAINQAIDYCKSNPQNYKHLESLEEYKNYLEDGSAIITLDTVTRGHKCKKSKCFCRLRVSKEIRAGSLFTSGNASISGALTAGSITTSGTLSAGSVSTSALTTSTINNLYPLLTNSAARVVLGSMTFPENLSIQFKLKPSSSSSTSYPYPYTADFTFIVDGVSSKVAPTISIGDGFKVGPTSPYFEDLSIYGLYPQSGFEISGQTGLDVDSFIVAFLIPVTFDTPFNNIPLILVSFFHSTNGVDGAGVYGQPGSVTYQSLIVEPISISKTGFIMVVSNKILVSGTQKDLSSLKALEENLSKYFTLNHNPLLSFIAVGS